MNGFFDDEPRCAACAGPIDRAGTGRPPTYCSDACRQRAHRAVTKPPAAVGFHSDPKRASGPPGSPPAASLPAIAAGIPTPIDAYGPARAYCEVRTDGYGVAFGTDGGRGHVSAGPTFPRPGKAIDLAALLNERIAVGAGA